MKFNRRIRLDRVGSATLPARIGAVVEVAPTIVCEPGAIVAVRALTDNPVYGHVEMPSGRLAKVVAGNLMAVVLGARRALHGYMGTVPDSLAVGDEIALLNMGGVAGVCDAPNKDLGPPIRLEVLGQVEREGTPLNIRDFALPPCDTLDPDGPPITLVFGTCMNSGKTFAAAEIIRLWTRAGLKVAAGKVSGVAAQRDLHGFRDNGAIVTASFVDCGLPSTVGATDLGAVSRAVVAELERSRPDAILLELGDGIIGGYNTDGVLGDPSLRARTGARVLCANDLVGAWGGVQYLEPLDHIPQVISGPVTDNAVGTTWIEDHLELPARNARLDPEGLARAVARAASLPVEISE